FLGALLPNPSARYAKSNVAAIARAAGPNLQAGDLVVLTQTEQLGALSYYLPHGLRYVTPLGAVADPGHVDWRDIVHRLSVADPCATVAPALAALPIGARVLEVNPLIPVGASGSAWSRSAHHQVAAIDELVGGDRALTPIRLYTDHTHPKPFSAVTGELFVKVAAEQACP
ncbi:MAG: hypothetical protein ACR2KC_01975, partial [Acidimicrobiales bacterium]